MYCFVNVKSTYDANNALSLMTQCVEEVRVWMTQSLLKLTEDKTDFLVISSPYFHESVCDTLLKVGDAVISSSVQCRNLGVIFDSKLDMKQHVALWSANQLCSSFERLALFANIYLKTHVQR